MIEKDTLEIYGSDFQKQLIYEMLTDYHFGIDVIDIINPNYFSDRSFSSIVKLMQIYYENHSSIPSIKDLNVEIESSPLVDKDTIMYKQLKDTVTDIQALHTSNRNVKERALNFMKSKKLYKFIGDIKEELEKGNGYSDFESFETKFQKHFGRTDTIQQTNVFDGIENVLADDFRRPIPTGIRGIDDITGGGLSRGELALLIAPLGVGKTTALTKIASSAYISGHKVIQFVFEDKAKVIQRKHFSIWSGFGLHRLDDKYIKPSVVNSIKNIKGKLSSNTNSYLEIIKLPADGVTVDKIKTYIQKIAMQKGAPDLVTIDYLDCINPEKTVGRDEWSSDGKIMRRIETIAEEMDFACWAATQGNRESTTATQITADKGGGSIKKSQIAHLVIGIAKILEQKEAEKATISIIKNRFGDDGMVYENCTFKNKTLHISTNAGPKSVTEFSTNSGNANRAIREMYNQQTNIMTEITADGDDNN